MEVEAIGDELQLAFPRWNPIRRRFNPDSPFFAAGNVERELLAKQVALDLSEEDKHQLRSFEDLENSKIYCPVVGCGALLRSLDDFEDHYSSRHSASCSVCSRVYPTSRLLSIHVSEVHDSFFQAKVARGFPMYECLVEGCGLKLKSYKSRQQHLVDKHKFPVSFEFYKKKVHPSKRHRRRNLHKKVLRKTETDGSSGDMQIEEDTMDELVSSVSKLSTSESPSSISFGRRHTRGLTFVPRAVQKPEASAKMKSWMCAVQ
ncbi:OLC1v1011846C1 [Oldenlandia corymbosa var. corymbosa]|uniref:OLC1v1011846C1 n=1 Tax=Oldenlandia corymbosa var. corymbosa TaxID=529605 RepID=A0AAV1DXX0_OLDCO|nr:OLC1v1011846C1 [Oldenlandia corymbosa var. corymbosa]